MDKVISFFFRVSQGDDYYIIKILIFCQHVIPIFLERLGLGLD